MWYLSHRAGLQEFRSSGGHSTRSGLETERTHSMKLMQARQSRRRHRGHLGNCHTVAPLSMVFVRPRCAADSPLTTNAERSFATVSVSTKYE